MKIIFQKWPAFTTTLIFFLVNSGCARDIGPALNQPVITAPRRMNDGWICGSLREAGMDSMKLMNLLRRIHEEEYTGIDGILIARNGKLVFEQYFRGYDFEYAAKDFKGKWTDYDDNTPHNLASVTKSVTAILCGIAIDRGFIRSVDEKLADFFPQDSTLFPGNKKKITLHHLLTMSSGLQWNEQNVPYGDPKNDIVQLFIVPEPLKHILSKPLAHEPGTEWYYNGGGTNLLGQIVQKTSGMRLDNFAEKYLFSPLEFGQSRWVRINRDFVYASGDLRLRPRDMAKLGELALDKGVWRGNRILSSQWIGQMTRKHVTRPHDGGYGYQWWLEHYTLGSTAIDAYLASGWGGQWIIVLPSLQTVVVVTGSNYAANDPTPEIMIHYVLPAIRKDFGYDFGCIDKEAPLPDDVRIVPSAGRETGTASALSGHWAGKWDANFLSCQLVVERIDGQEAALVYSWADHPSGYFKKGWVRKTVKIDSSVTIRFETTDKLNFRLNVDEDVLIGYLKNEFVTSRAILRRRE
jgi:CubicO group peptidase (beta-lactamase class C family)